MSQTTSPLELADRLAPSFGLSPATVRSAVQDWLGHQLLDEPEWLTLSRPGYVHHHLARSLAALALIPPGAGRRRVLELGSGIYLMTFLLDALHECELERTQYWGRPSGRYHSVLIERTSGQRRSLPFREFNAELEAFPYPTASFDVILNCEMIEHVLCNPVHVLAECHRVLKPGGIMVLTTPNAVRLDNVLALLRGQNIYDKYILERPSARHPREFTPAELRNLLEWTGFSVSHLEVRNVLDARSRARTRSLTRGLLFAFHTAERLVRGRRPEPPTERGECIVALVERKSGSARRDVPEFLFEAPRDSEAVFRAIYADEKPAPAARTAV